MQSKINVISIGLTCSILLTACIGGEPSQDDITAAYSKHNGNHGILWRPNVYRVEKISCVQAKEVSGYKCDVRLIEKKTEKENRIMNIRAIRDNDSWSLTLMRK